MDPKDFQFAFRIARQGGPDAVYGVESLEHLEEERKYLHKDTEEEEEEDFFWQHVRRGLKELPSYKWAEGMRELESSTLSRLVWLLEEKKAEAIEAAGEHRYLAVYGIARLMRTFRAAVEQKKGLTRISDYLHVLDLRVTYKLSTRKIARILDIDESKIRRWDKRAKELGVTRYNLDEERLRQIMKPPRRKRAPP